MELRNQSEGSCLEIACFDWVTVVIRRVVLREACRCGACLAAASPGDAVRADPMVRFDVLEAFGPNALRFVFSDGHDRGLFPFGYLRELPVHGQDGV